MAGVEQEQISLMQTEWKKMDSGPTFPSKQTP